MPAIFGSHSRIVLMLSASSALAACGGGGPAPGDFAAACNAQADLTPALCSCLDDQAQQLSPETHAFVIATIAGDDATALELRGDLDDNQSFEAGQFISRGIQECIIDLPDTATG